MRREIEQIIERLQGANALVDLQEMHEDDEAKAKHIEESRMDLLHDADELLSELTGRKK
jgi:hypothetical protein